jgi:SAM-dependent methyltransferase
VLRTVEAVQALGGPETPVLDVGSVGCPVLSCLLHLGYEELHGIDLDPRVTQMPGADRIDYRVADMMHTEWPDASFGAITAISVIEHGYDQNALLDEVARLLRPGGAFIFSTDYWPRKIPTEDTRPFGLDWQIFSAEEIEGMVLAAAERGLRPMEGEGAQLRDALARADGKPPIRYEGREYTFLYGVLARASQPAAGSAP